MKPLPLPVVPMHSAPRGYLQSFRCDASIETLWHALVEPEGLALWYAGEARIEAREGGLYAVRSRLLGRRVAHIDAFLPNRRLRLIYEPHQDWPDAGESVIVEDFLIDHDNRGSRDTATVLRMIGSGVPDQREWDPTLKRLRSAWAVSFSYLQKSLEAGDFDRLLAGNG